MPRVQDAIPSLDCRAWKRRSNPLLLSALRFALESRLWRFHAIHHNPEEVDFLVSTRVIRSIFSGRASGFWSRCSRWGSSTPSARRMESFRRPCSSSARSGVISSTPLCAGASVRSNGSSRRLAFIAGTIQWGCSATATTRPCCPGSTASSAPTICRRNGRADTATANLHNKLLNYLDKCGDWEMHKSTSPCVDRMVPDSFGPFAG